jgi:hypothetical protein
MHLHSPVSRSQFPRFEHSANLCAVSLATASSAHAVSKGQIPANHHRIQGKTGAVGFLGNNSRLCGQGTQVSHRLLYICQEERCEKTEKGAHPGRPTHKEGRPAESSQACIRPHVSTTFSTTHAPSSRRPANHRSTCSGESGRMCHAPSKGSGSERSPPPQGRPAAIASRLQ